MTVKDLSLRGSRRKSAIPALEKVRQPDGEPAFRIQRGVCEPEGLDGTSTQWNSP